MQTIEHRSFDAPDETRAFRQLAICMDDGVELVAGPGDVTSLPSGHDAWAAGDEPVKVIDRFGTSDYAKKALPHRRASPSLNDTLIISTLKGELHGTQDRRLPPLRER